MKLIQRVLYRLCFSTIVLMRIKTRLILKKAVLKPPTPPLWKCSKKIIRFGRMPLPFNLIASRRRCLCFWHINNQSLWSGIFVVQIYRGSLQIWFKIEQQSISVLWNLTVQHCKLYQNILNISWWRIVITNWNIGNDRVYFESMFASASFPSLVVGKWPCLLEIGSGRRNQQGNHGSKRFYFVCLGSLLALNPSAHWSLLHSLGPSFSHSALR